MKLTPAKRGEVVKPQNTALLQASTDDVLGDTPYYMLLALIADMLDTAIIKGDTYMIIGTTKDRSSLSLTVVQGSERGSVYGVDFADLATGASTLL